MRSWAEQLCYHASKKLMSKNLRLMALVLSAAVMAVFYASPITRAAVEHDVGIVLYGSLFMLSFTNLLLEHFFARPTDVLAASVSILLLIVPSAELLSPWGNWYYALVAYECAALALSTAALFLLTEHQGPTSIRNRASVILKTVAVTCFNGRAQYFWLFFLTLVHFVEPRSIPFITLAAYSALILFFRPDRVAALLPEQLRSDSREVGELLGVQGRNNFLVRLHPRGNRAPVRVGDLIEFQYGMDDDQRHRRGIALERFYLDQAQWLRVHCHPQIDEDASDLPEIPRARTDAVYRLTDNFKSKYFSTLVGVVTDGTNVRSLRFVRVGGHSTESGALLQLHVGDKPIIYQVVNARVDTQALERKNEADFVVGEAFQLGYWNAVSGFFETFGWVPAARTPMFKAADVPKPDLGPSEIELGCVPGSSFPVLLDKATAMSHHTAILGVTGVGKSVFSRHLVRQFVCDADVRVVVVDFTREWGAVLHGDGIRPIFDADTEKAMQESLKKLDAEKRKWPDKRNEDLVKAEKSALFHGFSKAIGAFLDGNVGVSVFELPDVANTELALEYTHWFFKTLFRVARDEKCRGKRVCIVLEEAHTVVPEWNFLGISDKASQSLVNSIGQVALQGRKYGVGFLVIAQRTASVSKTLLTQCNTIVAFQCFDKTSMDFLENYLPREVVQTLPTLPSRRAIAVGKAIRGTVPLIFDVPHLPQ